MKKKHRHKFQESLPGLRRVLAYFWPYVRKHRALMIVSVLALLAETAFRSLGPWPIKFVFDQLFGRGGHRSRFPHVTFLDGLDSGTVIAIAALSILLITVLRGLADYANTVGFSLIGNRVLTEARNDLYPHLQRLSLSFHTKAKSGDLTMRVIADVNQIKNIVISAC